MSQKMISIIIPVFNAAGTIRRCIDSLRAQTYTNIQIIAVDDASEDSTRDILSELEQEDPERIMLVFLEKNCGPGEARNIGLGYATGEYIGFIDSDDYVATTFYERLAEEMERGGHDMTDCGYYNEKTDSAMLHTGRDTRGVLDDDPKSELIASGGYLWSRLYKRELFTDYGISFRKSYILEDSEILSELIVNSRSIGAVEETLYWYSNSSDSLSGSLKPGRYVDSIKEAMKAVGSLKDRLSDRKALHPGLDYEIIQMYNYGIVMVLKDAQSGHDLDTVAELEALREIRINNAGNTYDNKYIKNKIDKRDIELMQANDRNPKELAKRYLHSG